jgi:hypothetical protein
MSDDDDKKEYMRNYMRKYIENSPTVICDGCGGSYRGYKKYRHNQTKKHINATEKAQEVTELDKLKRELEELRKMIA